MKNFLSTHRSVVRGTGKLLWSLAAVSVFSFAGATGPAALAGSATAPADARMDGEWSNPVDLGVIAINANLLPTGKVLYWQFIRGSERGSVAYLWDTSGTLTGGGG